MRTGPDLHALVAAAASDAETHARTLGGADAHVRHGLFVCVCGPTGMVEAAKEAVAAARSAVGGKVLRVGFHAEEPEW